VAAQPDRTSIAAMQAVVDRVGLIATAIAWPSPRARGKRWLRAAIMVDTVRGLD
jgi:hypothetical protein